jgi:hypothetical protein
MTDSRLINSSRLDDDAQYEAGCARARLPITSASAA